MRTTRALSRALAVLSCFYATTTIAADVVGATTGSFSVSPSGAAEYTIPIVVPPGIGEIEPRVALQFDSRARSGYLGPRFRLSGLSQISRCASNPAQDGVPYDPVDFDTSDRFCLDGQKLVSSAYGAMGAEYRTEIETFSKIESIGNGAGSTSFDPEHFVVRTKSGLVIRYGDTNDSRVTHKIAGAAESTRRTHIWLVSRVEDASGNYMTYTYEKNEAIGEVLPKEIRYTGNANAGVVANLKVVFNYRLRSGQSPTGFFLGVPQNLPRILHSIETFVGSTQIRQYFIGYELSGVSERDQPSYVQECAGSACFPPTRFTWEATTDSFPFVSGPGLPRLGSAWSQFVGDWDGDGRQDIIALHHGSSLTIRVYRSQADGKNFDFLSPAPLPAPAYTADWTKLVGDFNGDGRIDAGLVRNVGSTAELHTYLSDGGTSPTHVQSAPWGSFGLTNTDRIVGDVNGDGIRDIILFHSSRSNGVKLQSLIVNGIGEISSVSTAQLMYSALGLDYERRFGDFNRDGLMDVAIVHASSAAGLHIVTFLAQGDGTFLRRDAGLVYSSVADGASPVVADVNGDGNADFVLLRANGEYNRHTELSAFLSRGDGTFVHAATKNWYLDRAPYASRVGDVNADGIQDLILLTFVAQCCNGHPNDPYLGEGVFTFRGTPTGELIQSTVPPGLDLFYPGAELLVGDINGDAKADAVVTHITSDINYSAARVYHSAGGTVGQLNEIADGFGAAISIKYEPLTIGRSYGTSGGCGGYPVRVLCNPLYVVSEHTQSSDPHPPRKFTRTYRDLKFDFRGRGLLGPAQIKVIDEDNGSDKRLDPALTETIDYIQDFPYIGTPQRRHVGFTTGSIVGASVSETITTLESKSLTSGSRTSYFPFAKTITEKLFEPNTSTLVSTSVTTNWFGDGFGNLTESSKKFHVGANTSAFHEIYTQNTYQNDSLAWRIGRLTRSEVTRIKASGASAKRTFAYEYNPLTGLLAAETVEPLSPLQLRTEYGRDGFGNVTSEKRVGDSVTRAVCHEFDSGFPNYGRFSTKTIKRTNATTCPGSAADDHVEARTFDAATGNVLSATDPAGRITSFEYDDFGRQIRRSFAAPGVSTWENTNRLWCTQTTKCSSTDMFAAYSLSNAGEENYVTFDKLQRETARLVAKTFLAEFVSVTRQYDEKGRLALLSSPKFLSSPTTYWTSYNYDGIGRIVQIDAPIDQNNPSGRTTRFEYAGRTTRQYDALNRVTTKVVDVLGRLTDVTDPNGGEVRNAYDFFDNLTSSVMSARDATNANKSMSYDIRGRRLSIDDPDMGKWTFTYNAFGELISQRDAKNQVVDFTYDALGRLVTRNEPEGLTTWTYDTALKGFLTEASSPGHSRSYSYFPHGGVETETISIATTTAPPGAPAVTQFTASPPTIKRTQATTLSWTTNADTVSCSATGTLPGWTGNKNVNGSQSITVGNEGTYSAYLNCHNKYGQSTATSSVTVTVLAVKVVDSFTAAPTVFDQFRSTTLSWATTGASSCSGGGSLPGWAGAKNFNASQTLTVEEPGNYQATLTCYDSDALADSKALSLTVNYVPPVVIKSFSANPTTVDEGTPINLNWSTDYAANCWATGTLPGWHSGKAKNGSQTISTEKPGTYTATLNCADLTDRPAGSRSVSVTINDCLVPLTTCIRPPVPADDVDEVLPPEVADFLRSPSAPDEQDFEDYEDCSEITITLNPAYGQPFGGAELSELQRAQRCFYVDIAGADAITFSTRPGYAYGSSLIDLYVQALARPTPSAGSGLGILYHCASTTPNDGNEHCEYQASSTDLKEQGRWYILVRARENTHWNGELYITAWLSPTVLQTIGDAAEPSIQQAREIIHDVEGVVENLTGSSQQDAFGGEVQPTSESAQSATTTELRTYSYRYAYDSLGRLTDITYPSGLKTRNTYNAVGALVKVSNASTGTQYWSAQAWNEWGDVDQYRFANGIETLKSVDPAVGRLDSIYAGPGGGSSIQSLLYSWDSVDNLRFRQDQNRSLREDFTNYDDLDRLTRATLNNVQNLSLSYFDDGNIETKSGVGTYRYERTPVHGVSKFAAVSGDHIYDANGNLVSGGNRTFTWSSFDLPTRITSGSSYSELLYGASHERVRQLYETSQQGKLIYYVGDLYEEHWRGSAVEQKHYIVTPEGPVAIETRGAAVKTEYLHRDHLGSIEAITNSSGELVQRLSYDAFGKRRGQDWQGAAPGITSFVTARGFTGHEHLDSVGLIHMNGRVYDPNWGRFISADPFVPDPENSQSHNRFSYTVNNPLNRIDPSGFNDCMGGSCYTFDPSSSANFGSAYDDFLDPFKWLKTIPVRDTSVPTLLPEYWLDPLLDIQLPDPIDPSFNVAASIANGFFEGFVGHDRSVVDGPAPSSYEFGAATRSTLDALTTVGGVALMTAPIPGSQAAGAGLLTIRGASRGGHVFWSGIRGGADQAAAWAARNGGTTLESTLAVRGVRLPAFDPSNPASVAAWRQASLDFAASASGNVRVLQGDFLRMNSIWHSEFAALKANPNVKSITSINPVTGAEIRLWVR